jgi:hypothetical protein
MWIYSLIWKWNIKRKYESTNDKWVKRSIASQIAFRWYCIDDFHNCMAEYLGVRKMKEFSHLTYMRHNLNSMLIEERKILYLQKNNKILLILQAFVTSTVWSNRWVWFYYVCEDCDLPFAICITSMFNIRTYLIHCAILEIIGPCFIVSNKQIFTIWPMSKVWNVELK